MRYGLLWNKVTMCL